MFREPTECAFAPKTAKATACFSVTAEPEPGVMPRVLELFAKRGLTPSLWHSRVAPGGELTIDLQMDGMEAPLARRIAQSMRQVWGVSAVLTAEKG